MTAAVAFRAEEPVSPPPLKRLIDLRLMDCRWVEEEPSEENGGHWMYCGDRAKSETKSYCVKHHKIMFDPPKKRTIRAQRRL